MTSYILCCFLLQLLFGAVLAGTEMLALSGMSFLLFSNLTFHELMTLYRNGNQDHVMIARWEVKNATFTSIFLHPKYTGKIFMEIDKTPVIWICNVDQTLSAKYIVQYGINTTGPEVKLTMMENKQLDVCLNSPPNLTENYFGNLTEDEFQKWLDDHQGFMKKYFEKVMPEQMLPCNHPKEVLKESSDGWNPIFLGLLIVICIIGIMLILIGIKILLCILANKLPKEDQVHKWLNDHPDFMDKYLGKLTEDQIWKQIQKWEDAYPGLLKNKYLDAHENDQVVTPTLEELSVTLNLHSGTGIEDNPNQSVYTQVMFHASQHSDAHENDQVVTPTLEELSVTLNPHSGTGIEGNPNQSVYTQVMFHASQHSDEDVSNNQAVPTTLVEPPDTLTESGNEIEGNQMPMSTRKTFASQSSDDTATKPTLNELGVTLCMPESGTEDNQGQLESSQEDVISITCSSRSSVTFSEPGHSGNQPFNNDEQGANPEQNMAPYVRVVIEDSDSEDKCQEPLLQDHAKIKPST